MNRAYGIGEIEGKAAMGSGARAGQGASFKFGRNLVGRAVLCPPPAIHNRRARSDAPYHWLQISDCPEQKYLLFKLV